LAHVLWFLGRRQTAFRRTASDQCHPGELWPETCLNGLRHDVDRRYSY